MLNRQINEIVQLTLGMKKRLINENDVETVVLLRGEKVDGHIQVDFDIEELEDKSGISF